MVFYNNNAHYPKQIMNMKTFCFIIVLGFHFVLPAFTHADDAATAFKSRVMPVLSAHCTKCHGEEKQKGKVNLSGVRTLEQFSTDAKLWFRVLEQIESGTMPPKGEKPLTTSEKQTLASWTNIELVDWLSSVELKEGRSKFRRLNRNEYANTIHDLFGFRPAVVRNLPIDGRVDGYDKVSTALPFSSASAAGYVKITEDTLDRANRPYPKSGETKYRLWAGSSEQSAGHILELEDGTMVSFNTDTTSGPLRLKNKEGKLQGAPGTRIPGIHKLRISVYAYQTDKPIVFGIYAGHTGAYPQMIDLVKILEAPPGKPAIIETEIYLRTSENNDVAEVSDTFRLIPFGLGVQVPKNTLAKNCKGPGLAVQWVDIEEPELPLLGSRWLSGDLSPQMAETFLRPNTTLKLSKLSREEVIATMQKTFKRVGMRLFRRELTDIEMVTITANFSKEIDAGVFLATALRNQISALMTAPDFLCIVEQPGRLTNFALASRLSYFLWNSTPDEELLEIACLGKLTDSAVLKTQTDRLLKDPKSQRFINDFADQWLGLRSINDTTPDTDLYPEYDDLLKISSVMETQQTLKHMIDKNLSVRDFVAPKWALVNERLAKHYSMPETKGFALQEVKLLPDSSFGGIWTHASTMKVTANGTSTSPVKRGVWVAERLLGTPIPPPPPNIDPIDPDTRGAKTLREQLALHSGKGSCAACHAKFDPYGFALESFDVMGNLRTNYRTADAAAIKGKSKWKDGPPVDSTGISPEGAAFSGIKQLREILAKNPEQLARGVTRNLVTYSTGSPASQLDQKAIDAIVKNSQPDDYGLRSIIHGVIQSDLFRSK